MTAFVWWLLPETKNVPIEEMVVVWRKHWLWKHYVEPAAMDVKAGDVAKPSLSSYASADAAAKGV